MVVCCSEGGWFWSFLGQLQLLCIWWCAVVKAAGLEAFLASYNCFLFFWTLSWPVIQFFLMDSKNDGRHSWNVLFSGRFGPASMVVCCSAGGWFGPFPGFQRWREALFSGCFGLCFPVVLGLCLWWFAVVQAAGLDALAVFWSGSCCGAGNVVTIVFTWLVNNCFYGFQR